MARLAPNHPDVVCHQFVQAVISEFAAGNQSSGILFSPRPLAGIQDNLGTVHALIEQLSPFFQSKLVQIGVGSEFVCMLRTQMPPQSHLVSPVREHSRIQ